MLLSAALQRVNDGVRRLCYGLTTLTIPGPIVALAVSLVVVY